MNTQVMFKCLRCGYCQTVRYRGASKAWMRPTCLCSTYPPFIAVAVTQVGSSRRAVKTDLARQEQPRLLRYMREMYSASPTLQRLVHLSEHPAQECWSKGAGPELVVQQHTRANSTGLWTYFYGHTRITVRLGRDGITTDALHTLLHEIVHSVLPVRTGHDVTFYATLAQAAREIWSVPISEDWRALTHAAARDTCIWRESAPGIEYYLDSDGYYPSVASAARR